jgi:hypothetical protein
MEQEITKSNVLEAVQKRWALELKLGQGFGTINWRAPPSWQSKQQSEKYYYFLNVLIKMSYIIVFVLN